MFLKAFERHARRFPTVPGEVEVVLQPTEKLWLYYMADIEKRRIFWIDEIKFDEVNIPKRFGIERLEQLSKCVFFS